MSWSRVARLLFLHKLSVPCFHLAARERQEIPRGNDNVQDDPLGFVGLPDSFPVLSFMLLTRPAKTNPKGPKKTSVRAL
jgi:hypothetical protein